MRKFRFRTGPTEDEEGDGSDAAQLGLSDIVSNLMALFIILVLALLTVAAEQTAASQQDGAHKGPKREPFPFSIYDPIPPFVTTLFVVDGGYAILDRDGLSLALSESSLGRSGLSPRLLFVEPRAGSAPEADLFPNLREELFGFGRGSSLRGDVDAARLVIDQERPPPDWSLRPLDEEGISDVLALGVDGRLLQLFVYSNGVDAFAPLFDALVARGLCFRWRLWSYEDPVRLSAHSVYGERRCSALGR